MKNVVFGMLESARIGGGGTDEWSRMNAWRKKLFCDIGWWRCVEFPVRNRVSVNVYPFKMASSRFEVKNIRNYPG